MRIGIDLDGCVYDFTESLRSFLAQQYLYDRSTLPDPDRWNTWECWGMTMDVWLGLFKQGVQFGKVFRTGEPYEGAKATLDRLHANHSLHVVTHRDIHPRAIQSTHEWLTEYEIPFETLTFAKDKTVVPCDVFIEDNLDNYDALDAAGVHVLLMDRSWNQDDSQERRRVHSWAEFEMAVINLQKQRQRERFATEIDTDSTWNGRTFEGGATRNPADHKYDYEGFLSASALHRFAEYMHSHRQLPDGALRDSDNWQKGIPVDVYMKSLWRHFMDVFMLHRGMTPTNPDTGEDVTLQEALCGVWFNTQGMLHETLREPEEMTLAAEFVKVVNGMTDYDLVRVDL